jgi:hypothetical protein
MSTPASPPHPPTDPKPGANPGYDDANPRGRDDLPRDRRDDRGMQDGKVPNPEAGGLERDPVVKPDPAED